MAQRPRPLDPGASPEAFLGARVRAWRSRQGLSQVELGRRVHASGSLIAKIEKAERCPGVDLASRLDATLDTGGELARVVAQLRKPMVVAAGRAMATGHRRGTGDTGRAAGVAALRCLADVYDAPGDGITRSTAQLQCSVGQLVGWRLESDYARLLARLPEVVPEVTRALFLHDGAEREQIAALLVQTWRAADAVADKFGLYDLSARLIHVMGWAAAASGSDLAAAATCYVRAETFFASGQLTAGRDMLERAAEQIAPGTSVGACAQYGAMHMRAAVLAAGAGLGDRAADHLVEARMCSRGVQEGIWQGTAFGPASVRIHEVSVAVELNDPQAALAVAEGWTPPAGMPAERRSHFFIDLARAQLALGRGDAVLEALHQARVIAPEHVRVHPLVRQVLAELAAMSSRHASAARHYAAVMAGP